MPSEDKGRTKHEIVLDTLTDQVNEIEVKFDKGSGVLFLWQFELLVLPL